METESLSDECTSHEERGSVSPLDVPDFKHYAQNVQMGELCGALREAIVSEKGLRWHLVRSNGLIFLLVGNDPAQFHAADAALQPVIDDLMGEDDEE